MANKRINELALRTPQTTDLMLVGDPTTGYSYKATLASVTANLVPYTGATSNVNLGEYGFSGGFVSFDTTPTGTPAGQGTMYWDASEETLALIMNGTTQHIGQDTFYYVKNSTGATIAKGSAVGFAGTDGNSGHLLIKKFQANGTEPSQYYMGITAEEIANGAFGKVMKFGKLEGVNTSAFADGNILYVSTSVAGGFQTTVPVAPNNIIVAAAVVSAANNGKLVIRATLGSNINNDEGVKITSPTNGQVLKYNSTSGLWENSTDNNSVTSVFGRTGAVVAQSGDYTTTQVTEGTNLYYTDARARGAISLTTTGTSGAATYNSSTGVLNIPNYAPDLSAYVQGSGTANYIPKFTAASTIANSQIEDNGTSVGIGYAGSTPSLYLLDVNGESRFTDDLRVQSTTGNRKIRVRSGGSVGIELADTRVTTGKTWSIENGITSGLLGFYESSSAKFSLTTAGNGEFAGTLKASISALATASNAYVVSDGGVLKSRTSAEVLSDIGAQAALTNPITGTGTANYVSKFTASGTIGNSQIFDNGTFVGINTTTEVLGAGKLQVNGGGYFTGSVISENTGLNASFRIKNTTASTGKDWHLYSLNNGNFGLYNNTDASYALTITPSGAATFSSSVTANGTIAATNADIYAQNGTGSNLSIGFKQSDAVKFRLRYDIASDTVAMVGSTGNFIQYWNQSGNLGIGVTPSAWDTSTNVKVLQMNAGSLWGFSTSALILAQNSYSNTSGIRTYVANGYASEYEQASGQHIWKTAPSGTAGNAITFTQAMTLDASGNLGIGVTPIANNQLTIYNASYSQFRMQNSTTGVTGNDGFRILMDGLNVTITNHELGYLAFETSNQERMRITSAGYLLVGSIPTPTTDLLQVAGSGRFSTASSGVSPRTDLGGTIIAEGSTRAGLYILTSGTSASNYGSIWWGNGNTNTDAFITVNNSTRAMAFGTADGERMRIKSNGDIKIQAGNLLGWSDYSAGSTGVGLLGASEVLQFYTSGYERMRITSGGNVEMTGTIKTAAPTGYTAKPWKLGNDQGFGTNHTPTRSINVEIDGTVYFLQAVAASDI